MKLLIALDCTSFARNVALAGKALAHNLSDAELVFVHVLLKPDYYFSAQYAPILGFNEFYNQDLTTLMEGGQLEGAVREFLEGLKEELAIPVSEMVITHGEPEDVLLETIAVEKADILVIGKQNNESSKNQRLGHVTEAVLRQASIPVYVVPVPENG